jgi:hypothetical protein
MGLGMKAYILVKDSLLPGNAIVATAHASLAMYLKFQNHPDVIEWLSIRFDKVICKVSEAQFQQAKQFEDFVVLTESSLENMEVALAFRPRKEWPKAFRFYPLYK